MSVFVCDYDHNAPNAAHLAQTHYPFYRVIREARPTLPIIFMSKCDIDSPAGNHDSRRDAIYETFRRAREEGDKNVYYIDGTEVYKGPYEDMCTVDRCHPNDLGFALIADAVEAQLRRVLTAR